MLVVALPLDSGHVLLLEHSRSQRRPTGVGDLAPKLLGEDGGSAVVVVTFPSTRALTVWGVRGTTPWSFMIRYALSVRPSSTRESEFLHCLKCTS